MLSFRQQKKPADVSLAEISFLKGGRGKRGLLVRHFKKWVNSKAII